MAGALLFTLVQVAALGSGGCGETDIVAKHQKAVVSKIEAIARLHGSAEEQAGMQASWPTGPVAGLDFSGKPTNNAIVVQHDDLKDPREYAYISLRVARLDFDPFRTAQRVMGLVKEGDGSLNPNRKVLEDDLITVTRAKYALVVVFDVAQMPDRTFNEDTFKPGRVEGKAVLFEIEGAKVLGGFAFEAASSASVRSLSQVSNQEAALHKDLAGQVGRAVMRGIEERFPGAVSPGSFGN